MWVKSLNAVSVRKEIMALKDAGLPVPAELEAFLEDLAKEKNEKQTTEEEFDKSRTVTAAVGDADDNDASSGPRLSFQTLAVHLNNNLLTSIAELPTVLSRLLGNGGSSAGGSAGRSGVHSLVTLDLSSNRIAHIPKEMGELTSLEVSCARIGFIKCEPMLLPRCSCR